MEGRESNIYPGKLCGERMKLIQNIASIAHLLTELKTVFLFIFFLLLVLKHFWGERSLWVCYEKTMNSFS